MEFLIGSLRVAIGKAKPALAEATNYLTPERLLKVAERTAETKPKIASRAYQRAAESTQDTLLLHDLRESAYKNRFAKSGAMIDQHYLKSFEHISDPRKAVELAMTMYKDRSRYPNWHTDGSALFSRAVSLAGDDYAKLVPIEKQLDKLQADVRSVFGPRVFHYGRPHGEVKEAIWRVSRSR